MSKPIFLNPGDLVWAFDYPTDPPYDVCNACKLEYVNTGKGEYQLRRPDNGELVYFRYIVPIVEAAK